MFDTISLMLCIISAIGTVDVFSCRMKKPLTNDNSCSDLLCAEIIFLTLFVSNAAFKIQQTLLKYCFGTEVILVLYIVLST